MNQILNLPADLLRDQVFAQLELRDIVSLDSAILSHKVRAHVLPAIQGTIVSAPLNLAVEVDTISLQWLVVKGICVRHADFCGRLSDQDLIEHFSLLSRLESAKISGCYAITDLGIATLIRGCPLLHKLEIFTCFSITAEALRHVKGYSLRELHVIQCPTLSDETFTELIVECPNLETASIEGCAALTDTSVRVLSLICTKLREFTFRDNKFLTPQSVLYIAQNCTTLKKIVGEYSNHSYDAQRSNIDYQRVLEYLATGNKSLEHVELTVANVASAHITTFASLCPNLHTFILGPTDNDLSFGVRAVAQHCQSLTHLNVENVTLKSEVLWGIGRHCTKLKALYLPPIASPTFDIELTIILKQNPDLRTLVLEGSMDLNGEAFDPPTSTNTSTRYKPKPISMPKRSMFSPTGKPTKQHAVTNSAANVTKPSAPTNIGTNTDSVESKSPISTIATQLTTTSTMLNLTHVDVSECGMLQPTNTIVLFKRCPLLKRLNLSCNYVDVAKVTALGMHCKHLQYLNLTQCPGVNDDVLCALSIHCSTLTVLLLNACKATDVGLTAIISNNHKLEFLDLSWCTNMRDDTIYAIATHCTKLHTLKLSSANMSADAFKTLATRCTRLRKIVLRNCEFLTDSCLSTLSLHCTKLEDIFISDSELITERALRKFTYDCHRLLRGCVENCLQVNGRGGAAIYFSTS